jgi:disulfide bond formation protein DsbB
MSSHPSSRQLNALCALIILALILFALYLQHVLGEDPCPLCIFQRVAFIVAGIFFLLATLQHPRLLGIRLYGILTLLSCGAGASIAARQIYLQHLPVDLIPACGPGLGWIFQSHPWLDALKVVFQGSGECAQVGWTFAGLSIAQWSLVWFGLLMVVSLLQILRPQRAD